MLMMLAMMTIMMMVMMITMMMKMTMMSGGFYVKSEDGFICRATPAPVCGVIG